MHFENCAALAAVLFTTTGVARNFEWGWGWGQNRKKFDIFW